MEIIVDTREQKKLWAKSTKYDTIEIKALTTGDYSIKGHENDFAIERKSLSDLFGSLGSDHKRFRKEIERGLKMKYFAIIIDGSYDNALNKDFEGSHFTKMKGYVVTQILFTLHIKYNLPIFFTSGRSQSKRIIKELMKAYLKIN